MVVYDQLWVVYRQAVLSLLRASGGSGTQCWAYFVHHQAGLNRGSGWKCLGFSDLNPRRRCHGKWNISMEHRGLMTHTMYV